MACADPAAISGGTIITTGPYADQSLAVFQCLSGYVMTGSAYITCNTGTWTSSPSCSLQQTNDVTVNNNDDTSVSLTADFPTWLSYVIGALCGIIALLIITCILVWCLQLFGCYKGGRYFGHHDGCACCCRCRSRDRYDPQERSCKTFPRRYEYDENGRRYHFDDMGRRCYYHHGDYRNGKVVPDSPAPENRNTVFVSTISEDKKVVPAKEIATWKPHANPVRNINTSTK